MWKQFATLASITALTACGAQTTLVPSDDQAFSSFAPGGLFGGVTSVAIDDVIDQGGGASDGYGWAVGTGQFGGMQAQAGLVPGPAAVGSIPAPGVITYSGSYELGAIENIQVVGDSLDFGGRRRTGDINLIGNFNTGTLIGSGADIDVDARINGADLSGSVVFRGDFGSTQGQLEGVIGTQAAIGAFQGNDNTTAFAGGFNVSN